MVEGLHITSNGKIRVGGDEAMEPNFESLVERRGGGGSNERDGDEGRSEGGRGGGGNFISNLKKHIQIQGRNKFQPTF